VTETGWTWHYVDEQLTLSELFALYAHWNRSPTVRTMVAGYLGVEKKSVGSSDKSNLGELLDMFPDGAID